MIDPSAKLTVLHDDNSSFTDHSDNAADFIRDEFNLDLSSTEDYLYLGYTKPFGCTYIEMTTPNTNANTLNAEYFDGSSWTSVSLTDESKGLTRSGFLFWDKSSMKATAVDGKEAFYIRLRPSADHSASSSRGINLVFSDDNALKQEFFDIDNQAFYRTGETSHLVHHVATRNVIVQQLRNQNYKKRAPGSSTVQEINQWDLMDIFQVRQAATMLTLSKIFFLMSDSQEDTWWAKYEEYEKRYHKAMNLVRLAVDEDNDGTTDEGENNEQYRDMRWTR